MEHMKLAMKKTLRRASISREQLETIVVEVETMLNYRPLTYASSDLADPEPLILVVWEKNADDSS